MLRPTPPHPELIRCPAGRFGWLDDRLLHEGWLVRIGPLGTSVLLLLALAADRHGASFYGRERMGKALGLARSEIDQGLTRLLEVGLVAHRPWSPGNPDGVWQILPLPAREGRRDGGPVSIQDVLDQLGLDRR